MLTGPIGVGKSTIIRRVMAELGWANPAGFFTRRIDGGHGETSLVISTWNGKPYPIAFWAGPPQTYSAHRVDARALIGFAVRHLATISPAQPVVMDELGLLELQIEEFTAIVAQIFEQNAQVLAVIQERALGAWLERVGRERVDYTQFASPENRQQCVASLVAALKMQ